MVVALFECGTLERLKLRRATPPRQSASRRVGWAYRQRQIQRIQRDMSFSMDAGLFGRALRAAVNMTSGKGGTVPAALFID